MAPRETAAWPVLPNRADLVRPVRPADRADRWPAGGRIAILVRHNADLVFKEPGPLLSRLIQPLVLILLMRPLYVAALAKDGGPQAGTAQVVTGMLVMFSLLGLSLVGIAIMTERTWHTWDRLRATPARPGEMLLGKAVPAFGTFALQQSVVIAFGVIVFRLHVASPGLMAVAVTSWALALLGIGGTLGAVLRSDGELSTAYDIGGVLLSALGGAMVPLASLPAWARVIAPVSPGYWAMSALRSALTGQTAPTLRAAAVLLAIGGATGAIAVWRINRGWPRSRLL